MYVTADANIPIAIISNPLRIQFFLVKIDLLAPTPKRLTILAIIAVITAGVMLMKAKGRMGMIDAMANEKPVRIAALTGGQDSSDVKPTSSPRVYISSTNYLYDDIDNSIMKQGYISKGDVILRDGCWIGIGSCILSGVKIGKNSVIGANSVVTRNVPAYSVAVGNPAKIVKKFDFTKKMWISV